MKANLISLRRAAACPQGLAMGGVVAGLGLRPTALWAKPPARTGPVTLRGRDFHLNIGLETVNFTGSPAVATAVNGSVPAPILRWREGDRVTLRVTNHLPESTSIHWHGIILPSHMDGVPGISFAGIAPGETFTYQFAVRQSGTFWYHSHSGFQEQTGLYGPLVIDPRGRDPHRADRDYVVLLSDWTDEDPHSVYAKLKKLSHYYNRHERTVGDLLEDIRTKGLKGAWNARKMWSAMRMSDRDLSDVTGYTYTFLMNGEPPAEGWMGLFRRGEKVHLRFINASSMTFFDVRIPGLEMIVAAADGQDVEPVSVDEFRLGVAETLDVIVAPKADRAYTVFAQAIDRSGYARGTLTPDPSLRAPVPAMDPLPILTHVDMGMAMGHGGHAMAAMAQGGGAGADMASAAHAAHGAPGMGTMGHSQHAGNAMAGMTGMGAGGPSSSVMGSGRAGHGSSRPVAHAASEYGPQVDMHADGARYRLDDPGVGLRNNGRRVSYLVTADAKGGWAYHCHLLYHMPGMFRKVVVS
jgi:CopA family copper-resistance protein